jgi:hypothetical protein
MEVVPLLVVGTCPSPELAIYPNKILTVSHVVIVSDMHIRVVRMVSEPTTDDNIVVPTQAMEDNEDVPYAL